MLTLAADEVRLPPLDGNSPVAAKVAPATPGTVAITPVALPLYAVAVVAGASVCLPKLCVFCVCVWNAWKDCGFRQMHALNSPRSVRWQL